MASDKKTPNAPKTEQITDPQPEMEQALEPQNVLDNHNRVMDAALDEVKGGATEHDKPLRNDPVADKFKGSPMRDLIGGPLIAAAEAQQNLAAVAFDFYKKIAFEDDGKKTRIIEFNVKRPVKVGGKMEMMEQKIEAPFIGLVPIPSLLIDRIDIDFQMEVTDTNVDKSSSTAEASTKVSGGWWVTTAEVTGKVSSSRENTRTTNQSAKYQVHVTASQQPQTEGLSKLMDIMASCIEPVAAGAKDT